MHEKNGDKEELGTPSPKKAKLQNVEEEVRMSEVNRGMEQGEQQLLKLGKRRIIETPVLQRPKRHIRAPNRFIFDDEEREEQEKRKSAVTCAARDLKSTKQRLYDPKKMGVEEADTPRSPMDESSAEEDMSSSQNSSAEETGGDDFVADNVVCDDSDVGRRGSTNTER
ncbi:unnamed protein product [Gongylonema pulchrum]|uniref:Uncharacterized protein n=1 Tax=Gongylonema pulchrum TaxID=637853 RepID=A0A183E453_9BILA|nr:unnamed protein product [Gongylonema pulchrum]